MPDLVVIEDPTGERAVVDAEAAVAVHAPRGFRIVGPAVSPGDVRTVVEAADEAEQLARQVAEATGAEPPLEEPAEGVTARQRKTKPTSSGEAANSEGVN